jgi:hypothetical protein
MKRRTLVLLAVATAFAGTIALAAHAVIKPKTATALGRSWASFNWRNSLPAQFQDVGQALQLTPTAVADLFDLLAKQQQRLAKNSAGLLTGKANDPGARQAFQNGLVEQERRNQSELSEALGDKYQPWLEYQSTLAIRQQVESLRLRLASGVNALREDQVAPLIKALTPEQIRLDRELRAWDTSSAAATSKHLLDEHMRRTIDNQRHLLEVASTFLDPAQREEYWRVLDRIAMREVVMTRMMGKLGTAPVQVVPEVIAAQGTNR